MTNYNERLDEVLHINGVKDYGVTVIKLIDVNEAKQAILDWHNKQVNEAIHRFHGFVMEADIIRPEADQAFTYGRLHRAIDDYNRIMSKMLIDSKEAYREAMKQERNKLNNSDGDAK